MPNTGVSTFANHNSQRTNQSLQKSLHLSHPDKKLNKNFLPSENKKYANTQTDTTMTAKPTTDKDLTTQWTERQCITAVAVAQLPKLFIPRCI